MSGESTASSSDVLTAVPPGAPPAPSLATFTLDLAKAMLRTGYYAPDHPQARQSLEGLHGAFRAALGDGSGLTYLVGRVGDADTVMVQGHGEGPQTLDHIMIRGMAELFAPKLLDFFHRRRLVSFSLRAPIAADELSAFVVLMSEPPQPGRVEEERERLEQALLDRHILNVSAVFEADILGRERRLPWRVEMALSRLGRDLRMLPLYRDASPEDIQRVKIQIIDDVIRPLQGPTLVRDLLLHCDLLAADIAVLGSAQVEREIIAQVPADRLLATCQALVDDLENPDPARGGRAGDLAERPRLILRHVLIGLAAAGVALGSDLVEACVRLGAATFEELPKKLRKQLQRRRAVDTFLVRREDYLRALRRIPSGEKGVQLVRIAEVLFGELLNRQRYADAAAILVAVTGAGDEEESARTARELLGAFRATVGEKDTVKALAGALKLDDQEREVTDAVIRLLVFAGEPAVPRLRKLYRKNERRFVRAHAFEALKGIGPAALVPFLTGLGEVEPEWSGVHHVLTALAGLDDPALAPPILPFLRHEHPRVRLVALTRVFELEGDASQDNLIEALGDEDAAVRHAAVAYLGRLRSVRPEALAFFTAALGPELKDAPRETSDEVLAEVCRSLAAAVEASPERAPKVEELLRSALARPAGGVLSRLRRPSPYFSERVRVAICGALGSVCSRASLVELRSFASGEGAVAEAARAAAERIEGAPASAG